MVKLFPKIAKSTKITLYVVVALLVLVALIVFFTNKQSKTTKSVDNLSMYYNTFEGFDEDLSKSSTKDNKGKIILVYADWCPYCKEYLAEHVDGTNKNAFDLASEHKDMKNISFELLDAAKDDASQTLANEYGVKAYPTIIAVKHNKNQEKDMKVATFDGNRSDVDELVKFAQESLMN
jgi:thiol-disulfide isomerase/thioredoxin